MFGSTGDAGRVCVTPPALQGFPFVQIQTPTADLFHQKLLEQVLFIKKEHSGLTAQMLPKLAERMANTEQEGLESVRMSLNVPL